ncbi:type IV secretory system conjugative DNA transfer family protein [Kordiimonas pumila]|uniref:Type IV secretory system conjugative DNA transfer family protein n=1 Tax=Kordiimonas pumila TaxID=2161677 RepID=A0ABV7D5T7_9PROT|nr:type IV secretory system conjugative DNA transfer family protein [Kordiimonas pumila]
MLVRNRDYSEQTEAGVYIGCAEPDNTETLLEPIWFTGEGSLVTIAPPGAGKGQALIIPNLLVYDGPAIVLDIKGENYDLTHEWRRDNVGPVYKFAPFEKGSHNYNPLDFLDHKDPVKIWDGARLIATMLTVQTGKPDFWEGRAQDLLAAIIAQVKLNYPAKEQNMQTVLDMLYPTESDLKLIAMEMQNSPIRALKRTGNILSTMPEKQREGILDSARRHVDIWQSERVENITSSTDWLPEDFWKPPYPTLYICIPVGQVSAYASVLRVLIGQHIDGLIANAPTREERTKKDIPPALLLIDEMPQLGYMQPIQYSIEVGRSYGLRTWMFAQSLGQLRKAYPDADGLMEMCYIQSYMNPEFDTAKRLSDRLGSNDSLLRGKKQRIAEPQELMSEAYANTILTFARGKTPIKLFKQFAYEYPYLMGRMGTPKA